MARIDHCILFDDDPSDLRARQRLAEDSLKRILANGKRDLEFDNDVMPISDREEFLNQLLNCRGDILILADMHGANAGSWGNLGARVLRAAADHPDVGRRTWRILWTRHNHPEILKDVRPFAHAVALYPSGANRDLDATQLDDAIWNVLTFPPSGAAEIAQGDAPRARAYPAMRTVEQWKTDLKHRLGELLDGELMRGDETIALRLYQGDEAAEINADLSGGPDSRPSVDALLSRIIAVAANKVLNKTEAKERLIRQIGPVAQETAYDDLKHPRPTEDALKCIEAFRAAGLDEEHQRDDTWLPPDLYRLACDFLDTYTELKRATNDQRIQSGEKAIAANAFTKLVPIQGEALDAYEEAEDDLTYAVWTLRDTYRALRAADRV